MNLSIFCQCKCENVGFSYNLITIVITLCILSACSSSNADISKPNLPPVAPETIAEADKLFAERKDLTKLRDAIALLTRARRENAKNYDVEWRLARYNYFLGRHTKNDEEREKAFEDGKDAGKIAIRLDPNKPDGHFWFGANLGEQANQNPLTTGLQSVDEIREAMNKVIEIQPGYELASAYDVLGQLELGTRMMGGSAEKAVEYLEKAVAMEKNNGEARLHLAEAYLAINKDAEARKQLDYILQMKPGPQYIAEYEQQAAKARRLLETKF